MTDYTKMTIREANAKAYADGMVRNLMMVETAMLTGMVDVDKVTMGEYAEKLADKVVAACVPGADPRLVVTDHAATVRWLVKLAPTEAKRCVDALQELLTYEQS